MTPKGVAWTDEQKQRQSDRMKQINQRRSPADRRISALRGHATRRMLRELKDAITDRKATR